MKIVIDTNSLIDASSDDYNFGNRIIDEVIAGKIEAFANRATLAENRLMASKKITDQIYLRKLNNFFDSLQMVDSGNRLDVVEDPEDNKILESAYASDSRFLITSDNHLLKIGEFKGIKILPPAAFWKTYEEEHGLGWKNWLADFIK